MRIYGQTDTGCIRPNNQDAFCFGELSPGTSFAVVCDGMGGANGGSVASSLAVDTIAEKLKSGYQDGMPQASFLHLLESAVSAANALVYDESMADADLRGMGTTVVAAIVQDGQAYLAHVGDSRIYLADGDTLQQLTRDHSIVQEMVEKGQLTPQEAKYHPRKHFITRAVGVDSRVTCDFLVTDFPSTARLLLCTDGLTNMLETDSILSVVGETEDPAQIPARLIDLAKQAGGNDNITVVLILP